MKPQVLLVGNGDIRKEFSYLILTGAQTFLF